jgi:hypothetical protein
LITANSYHITNSLCNIIGITICIIGFLFGLLLADELKPSHHYKIKYNTLSDDKKVKIKSWLVSYDEIKQYNSERIKENRAFINMDFDILSHFVAQKESQNIDDELNQDYLKKPEAKALSTSL